MKVFQRIIFFIFVIILAYFIFSATKDSSAETVYIKGNIYTINPSIPKASALALKGQYLLYVGNDKDVKKYIGKNTKVIELNGLTVIPGIIEGHMHFPMLGETLMKIDAFWKPQQEIIDAVKDHALKITPGEWIQGFGWNNEVWENKSYPNKEMLDKVSPNNPVILERTDGHMIWVNSLALKLAGITKETKDPQGGEILRDKDGNPTGCLVDAAYESIYKIIPPLNNTRKKEALLKVQEQLITLGITSCVDAGSPVGDIENIKTLYNDGKLIVRIYCMIGGPWGENPGTKEKEYYKKGPQIGLFENRFTLNAIKLYADGSLGSRSAALIEDYSDRPRHKGLLMHTDEEMYNLVKEIRTFGYQASIHAIGDAGISQVLDVYAKVLKEKPLRDHRYRIEHFQVATLDDIKRIASMKVIPAMQPTHATSDKNMAENRVGSTRIKGAYAWRKIINAGSIIAGGSDAPVEFVNPFYGLYAAVTRMDRDGNPHGGWYIEESMTREEALKSFTIWAAYAQFEEKIKGSLEKGKLADFVLIDRDYFKCPATEIKDIQVIKTILGGKIVYEKK